MIDELERYFDLIMSLILYKRLIFCNSYPLKTKNVTSLFPIRTVTKFNFITFNEKNFTLYLKIFI